jgi:hypothetical protein
VEPTVNAIRTSTAALAYIWLAGFERLLPGGEHTWAVIRMIAVDLASSLELLECRAEKLQAVAVGSYEVAVWIHEDDEGRKAIEDQFKMTLARMQSFLGLPRLLDIDVQSAPFGDLSGCVG